MFRRRLQVRVGGGGKLVLVYECLQMAETNHLIVVVVIVVVVVQSASVIRVAQMLVLISKERRLW